MKNYTSLEQSKKLAEILPLDSADMYYFLDPTPAGNIYHLVVQRVDIGTKNFPKYDEGDIPCWSLAALLGVLPTFSIDSSDDHYFRIYCQQNFSEWYDNPIDACYKMIIKLNELNLL